MRVDLCLHLFKCHAKLSLSVCGRICLTAEMQRGRNHTCDVLRADLMERHCTIHISKNAWRCLSWCWSGATRAANGVAEYVHVHILHGTNLIHPSLFLPPLSPQPPSPRVCCLTRRQLYSRQNDILGYGSVHRVIHVTPLLFSAN